MPRLIVRTYENDMKTPTVVHEFVGSTRARVLEIARAHRKSDAFFDAAVAGKDYQGIKLKNEGEWRDG